MSGLAALKASMAANSASSFSGLPHHPYKMVVVPSSPPPPKPPSPPLQAVRAPPRAAAPPVAIRVRRVGVYMAVPFTGVSRRRRGGHLPPVVARSEERRVGKECRGGRAEADSKRVRGRVARYGRW